MSSAASSRGSTRRLPLVIQCPMKGGPLAIARCEENQALTTESGKSCRCSMYAARSVMETAAVRADARAEGGAPTAPPTPRRRTRDKRRGRHVQKGKCINCGNHPPEGTYLRDGLCKPCRPTAPDEKRCTACNQPPIEGERLYDGVCRSCRRKAKVAAIVAPTGEAPASADPAARQLMAPAVAAFEIDELRKRMAQLERHNVQLRARLHLAHTAARSATRAMERFAEKLRPIDEPEAAAEHAAGAEAHS